MWRIAHSVYRVFRNTATCRCSQDVLLPLTAICHTDDESKSRKQEKCPLIEKIDINFVLKHNQFTFKNLEKLQEYLKQFSIQQFAKRLHVIKAIEPSKPEAKSAPLPPVSSPKKSEETLDSILESDEPCRTSLRNLRDLHEGTSSTINLELALDALESGDPKQGVELLQICTKTKPNSAALFNLGICYERGIGVEQDRAKACDYYRQASLLGHVDAQFNLTILSNNIDTEETDVDDEQSVEPVEKTNEKSFLHRMFARFSIITDYHGDQSSIDHPFDFKNQTIACLS